MGFKLVFRTLQEIFPQVDLRILKAVAIEHSTDVDAAVEFILFEFLPSLDGPSVSSNSTHETRDIERSSVEGSHAGNHSYPKESSSLMHCHEAVKDFNPSQSFEEKSSEHDMNHIADYKDDGLLIQSPGSENKKDDGSISGVHGGNGHDKVISNPESGKNSTEEKIFLLSLGWSDAPHANDQAIYELESKEMFSSVQTNAHNSSLVNTSELMDDIDETERFLTALIANKREQCSRSPVINHDLINLEANEPISASIQEKNPVHMNIGVEVQNINSSTKYGDYQRGCSVENCSDSETYKTTAVDIDDSNLPSTQSNSVLNIDFLEDFIADAKNKKKTLASAVETALEMMKEVEILEEQAILAKEAASLASQDILTEVDELKQTLKHAEEANNMHAGEVFGERAILATEARELQYRLLSLSNERKKFLSIIDEIHQTLEERLAAAKEEIAAAEQEKLEKEELAHKSLHEQEAIMEAVREESDKLHDAETENSHLRDFLMDRGRAINVLQDEITVICEDILLLKERVAGRMELGISQHSIASSILASPLILSSRSVCSSPLSDRTLHPVVSNESLPMINHEDAGNHMSDQALYPVVSNESPPMINHEDAGKHVSDQALHLVVSNESPPMINHEDAGKNMVPLDDDWELLEVHS